MQVDIVDLNHVSGTKENLCYGIARTFELSEKKAQTYRTEKPYLHWARYRKKTSFQL